MRTKSGTAAEMKSTLAALPLVGIVTPFYNTREYLAECIESVLGQTYPHWQYVLVDNYSTDGSGEIARQYASRFPDKVKVIQPKSFLDQVPNYNFGLQSICTGTKYSKMVQADDWIYPECLERMVAVAESDEEIGIVSSYRLKGKHVLGEGLPYTKSVVLGREICRLQLKTGAFAFGTPTTMLYRSVLISPTEPFFDENSFFDDTDSSYRELNKWKFGFVHQILSFSRVEDESIRGKVKDFNPNALDRFLQLSKFGKQYLDEEEFAALMRSRKGDYYDFLARAFLSGRRGELWSYHLSGLYSGGLKLEKSELFKHICLALLKMVVNPGQTAARIYRKIRSQN